MKIGISTFPGTTTDALGQLRDHAEQAAADGFANWWIPQVGLVDALTTFTALADVGRTADGPPMGFGTGVIPIYQRHPTALAAQALTTAAALGDRPLVLGIGLSHRPVIEGMLGLSFDRPVRDLIDYLEVLQPLLDTGSVSYAGESYTTHYEGARPTDHVPSVMVAALGEQVLRVAGHRTDGTILWMVGRHTVADHIAPRLTRAAADAGRPAPRICCSLPVCVTGDPDRVRAAADQAFAIYGQLPSYRAMLDREGAAGPGDVALVGTEEEVAAGLSALAEAGVTDFSASEFGTNRDEFAATRALLRDVIRTGT